MAVTSEKVTSKKAQLRNSNFSVLEGRQDLIRTEKLDGKDYLVAPVTPIVEGVHNGEYVSYEELVSPYADIWNGRPLPVTHPMDANNEPVTAGSPTVMESSVVGFLFNVQAREDIRGISGELWIDLVKAETVPGGSKVVQLLQAGQPLEVSTGYYTFVDNTKGVFINPRTGAEEKYTGVQVQLKPDHLALLPNDEGACSWKDGCGAPRINQQTDDYAVNLNTMATAAVTYNVASKARHPSFSGTETSSWGAVDKSFGAYARAYIKSTNSSDSVPSSINDASDGMKKWIASKTLLGEASATTLRDLIFFPVVNPGTGKLNKGALLAVISGRGSQASIPASAITSAQNEARALLKSEFQMDTKNNQAVGIKVNGSQLAAVLQGALECYANETGSDETIADLAQAADIDAATMSQIVAGKIDFVPRQWLAIWAAILDIDPFDMQMAASNDNCDARYDAPDIDDAGEGDMAMAANAAKKIVATNDGTGVTIPDNHEIEQSGTGTCAPCAKSLTVKIKEILQTLGIIKSDDSKEVLNNMTPEQKKIKVDGLIASNKNKFTEAHRVQLTAMADADLELLDLAVVADPAVAAPVTAPVQNVAAVVAPVAPTITKEVMMATLGLSEEELASVKSVTNAQKATRANKITQILAVNGNTFTQEELAAFSEASLDKTLAMLVPNTTSPFRVAAGARIENAEEIAIAPTILLAKPGVKGVDFAVQTSKNAQRGTN
jgi:hypothetical protein